MRKKIGCVFVCLLAMFAVLSGCNREVVYQNFPDDGVFRINTAGTFEFSGAYRGQIYIDAPRDAVVELVFNNFSLYNPAGSAIHARRSERVDIVLPAGTTNSVTNRGSANDTVHIQHDLVITGYGTLNVTAHNSHALRAQDFLTIDGGIVNVTAYNNALRGRDGVVINGGHLTLTTGGNAIRSTNDAHQFVGIVEMNGGIVDIVTQNDGINVQNNFTMNGGTLNITSRDDGIFSLDTVVINGGEINILDSVEGIEAQSIDIRGGDVNVFAINDGLNARYADEDRLGTVFIRMRGGNVSVSSLRDSIESDHNVYLEGGTMHLNGVPSGRPAGSLIFMGTEFVSSGNTVRESELSTQRIINASLGSHTAGAEVELRDANGNVRLSHTAQRAFSGTVAFSSAEITTLGTYYIYVNGSLQHTATP